MIKRFSLPDGFSMARQAPVFLFLLWMTILSTSCRKNGDRIPDVLVDIYVSPTEPGFTALNAPGGWVNIVGGSRGILVYRRSLEEFLAYERHCPYQPSSSCARVEVDSTNIHAYDPCCGSVFLLLDGSVVQGPSSLPLKQYQTAFDGTWLHIYN